MTSLCQSSIYGNMVETYMYAESFIINTVTKFVFFYYKTKVNAQTYLIFGDIGQIFLNRIGKCMHIHMHV